MCDKRPLTQGREATYITPNSQLAEWSVASGKHSETLDRDTSKTPKAHLYVTDVWAMLCGDPGSIPQIVAHQLRARQTQSKCCAVGIDTCNRVVVMQAVAETRCGGGHQRPVRSVPRCRARARGLPGQDRTHPHRLHATHDPPSRSGAMVD